MSTSIDRPSTTCPPTRTVTPTSMPAWSRLAHAGTLAALAIASPAALAGEQFDFAQVTALAQGAINGQNVATPVAGFELVLMREGVVIYQQSFGNWSNNRIANCDSATKTLSGALIVALEEAGAPGFSLDARLSDFIPSFTGSAANVTIRQAFAHTSGIRSNNIISSRTLTLRQTADTIASETLVTTPGAVFAYGGTSMHAAGAAAEVAAGQPWNTLFAQRLTGPLGMPNTRFVLTTPANPRIAGGAESNGVEFARFMQMLLDEGLWQGNRVLGTSAVRRLLTRQTAPNIPIASSPLESADYGVGIWLDQRDANGRLVGALAAGARGFSAWLDLDDDYVGVLSTDVTSSGNIRLLGDLLRDAARDAIRLGACDSLDFNNDGDFPTPADLEAFVAAIGGSVCAECSTDLDFNNDGDFPTPLDVEAFVVRQAGGPCVR